MDGHKQREAIDKCIKSKEKRLDIEEIKSTANKVFRDYDKIYKLSKKVPTKTYKMVYKKENRKSKIKGLGITYCIGCGIYGFIKGITKQIEISTFLFH